MAEVQKTHELVGAQQTSPENPQDSAKKVRKQKVEASAYDFEKSLIKVTRQEADSQLKNTQENLRQSSYDVLVDNVNAA
ncbi:hypothetical protein HUU51_05660, partial [Candidatus Gracilibacteria bacterium]|nr:hypothetical protein [Candidatus Gracilibacteria bacterium]